MKTLRGACHCGRIRFEVDVELDHVRVCDCSICLRRGALIHRIPEEHVRIETPFEEMTLYQWHTRSAEDWFCPVCGVLPFRRPRFRTPDERAAAAGQGEFTGWSVNVRCLEGVDFDAIPVRVVRGSRLP